MGAIVYCVAVEYIDSEEPFVWFASKDDAIETHNKLVRANRKDFPEDYWDVSVDAHELADVSVADLAAALLNGAAGMTTSYKVLLRSTNRADIKIKKRRTN